MNEQKFYKDAIKLLDDSFEQAENALDQELATTNWKERTIYFQFRQSTHILFALLSNSTDSKFKNPNHVIDIVLIGMLGRLIRDIYVNIIYLRTTVFSEENMKSCWEYQIVCQKLNAIKFENLESNDNRIIQLEIVKSSLKQKLKNIKFSTKGEVFKGKSEKLLSLQELSDIYGFNKDKFHNEFIYFSQFAHSSAFANSFVTDDGVYLGIIAATYDRILAYYTGILAEVFE